MPEVWVCPFFPNLVIMWIVFGLALVWSMVWKGIALWRAGQNGDLVWFIVLFLINTLGILEIIYIFIFGRRKD